MFLFNPYIIFFRANLPKVGDVRSRTWSSFGLTLKLFFRANLPKAGDPMSHTWPRFC